MPIPDYQAIMLPLLRFAGDGKEHSLREALDALARQFKLTEEEIRRLLPSGTQTVFHNRVSWARSYMGKAGLLESPRRGRFMITKRGLDLLAEKPKVLNSKYLEQFPEFMAFQNLKHDKDKDEEQQESLSTPEETLETGYQRLRDSLAQELLDRVKSCSPVFFLPEGTLPPVAWRGRSLGQRASHLWGGVALTQAQGLREPGARVPRGGMEPFRVGLDGFRNGLIVFRIGREGAPAWARGYREPEPPPSAHGVSSSVFGRSSSVLGTPSSVFGPDLPRPQRGGSEPPAYPLPPQERPFPHPERGSPALLAWSSSLPQGVPWPLERGSRPYPAWFSVPPKGSFPPRKGFSSLGIWGARLRTWGNATTERTLPASESAYSTSDRGGCFHQTDPSNRGKDPSRERIGAATTTQGALPALMRDIREEGLPFL